MWKTRLLTTLALTGPLYLLPSLVRSFFAGWWCYGLGALCAAIFGCLVVGFLTNSYRFALLISINATVLELLLIAAGHPPSTAIWISGLIPAVVAIYFVQKLVINMGD